MSYLHLLPFVNNEQYGEDEMSWFVLFVYVFAFNLALNLSPLVVCWEWSNIDLLADILPLSNFPNYYDFVVLSEFLLF